MEYKTIENRAEDSFVVKKSEFIGHIAPVDTEDDAISFVNEIRARHRKATHNCYAYIIRQNNTGRHSDDGEPQGTAGLPIREVLAKETLTDIACVVTRYYGGIMLGAGGLVRAYSNGAAIAVAAAKIKLMAMAQKIHIEISYPLYGVIGGLLNNEVFDLRVVEEIFSDKVDIRLFIRTELADKFIFSLVDLTNGSAIIKKCGEEYYDFG